MKKFVLGLALLVGVFVAHDAYVITDEYAKLEKAVETSVADSKDSTLNSIAGFFGQEENYQNYVRSSAAEKAGVEYDKNVNDRLWIKSILDLF